MENVNLPSPMELKLLRSACGMESSRPHHRSSFATAPGYTDDLAWAAMVTKGWATLQLGGGLHLYRVTASGRRVVDGEPTRALSLTGPWWWFMLCLPPPFRKNIENRRPGFSHKSFRGPCWVHATRATRRQYDDAVSFALMQGVTAAALAELPSFDAMPVGGIVGRFTVVDMLPVAGPLPDRWRMAGQVGFVVQDAEPVPFVPCKGALGFWRVPTPVLERLRVAQ